jgi:hypothetical protein
MQHKCKFARIENIGVAKSNMKVKIKISRIHMKAMI